MRTDLVGGAEIVAKVEALIEQQADARQAREAAATALRDAKRADLAAGAEALRTGSAPPDLTEPDAQRALQDAERHLEVVTLALSTEREALHGDIARRVGDIRASLAKAQDDADEAIFATVTQIEDLLHERAEIKAHVLWLDDTTRAVGRIIVPGLNAIAALREQLGDRPGSATSEHQAKLDHEARVDAWNALVSRAKATVSRSQLVPVRDDYSDTGKTYPELDAAIEREYDRMIEAGETPPTPVTVKWVKKLGTTAKPKGQGTGWAKEPRAELAPMPPDETSVVARHADLVKV